MLAVETCSSDRADVSGAGAFVQRGLDADALVDGAPDLGRGGGGVGRLDDGAADDDDAGAGVHGRRGRLAVDAAGRRDRDHDGLGNGPERLERRLAAHLLVDGRVDADVVGAELLRALRARHRLGDLDHVDDQLAAVVARRLGALLDRRVGRGAEYADDAGAGLGRVLDLGAAGVHRLHVGDDASCPGTPP